MIPVLLAIAAAALYLLPLMIPKPPPPDDVALPPLPGPAPTPADAVPSFVGAVAALDAVVSFLRSRGVYGTPEQQAARAIRAAMVAGATPEPEGAK
jgi:hypothetical protein